MYVYVYMLIALSIDVETDQEFFQFLIKTIDYLSLLLSVYKIQFY